MGAEAVVVAGARLHQRLLGGGPVPAFAFGPLRVFDEHAVGVFGVGTQTGDPAMIGRFGLGRGYDGTAGVLHLDARRPIRRRARADGILARRVDVPEVVVVHELGRAMAGDAEIERAPGDERRLVGDGRQIDIRLGVKLRHQASLPASAAERFVLTLAAGTKSMANAGSALDANRLPVEVSAPQTSA